MDDAHRLPERPSGSDPDPFEDIAKAVGKVFPVLKCPVCAHESFAILESADAIRRTHMERFEGSSATPADYVETVSLACANCGYLVRFLEPMFRNLLKRMRDGQHG